MIPDSHDRNIRQGIWLLTLILLCGCAHVHHPTPVEKSHEGPSHSGAQSTDIDKVEALQAALANLNGHADRTEAAKLAETAIQYSNFLAAEYQVVRPAVWHNVLVRMGLKDRGLCYHWTEDLMKRLQRLELKYFRLHWGVAHRGSELREHNSVVVTADGQAFEDGIILDPWRNSGNLYWARVKADYYPWKVRPPEEW